MNKFIVLNENCEFKDTEVLYRFKVGNNDKEYVLCSIDNSELGYYSLIVSYLVKNDNGYDSIRPITNHKEREVLTEILKNKIKGDALNGWF